MFLSAVQECPSLSGIPLGLGAGFKLGNENKEKEKDRERDNDKDKDPDKRCARAPRVAHREARSKGRATRRGARPAHSSWTSMLEDFSVDGMSVVGARHAQRTRARNLNWDAHIPSWYDLVLFIFTSHSISTRLRPIV
jgi:hypothetical protein